MHLLLFLDCIDIFFLPQVEAYYPELPNKQEWLRKPFIVLTFT